MESHKAEIIAHLWFCLLLFSYINSFFQIGDQQPIAISDLTGKLENKFPLLVHRTDYSLDLLLRKAKLGMNGTFTRFDKINVSIFISNDVFITQIDHQDKHKKRIAHRVKRSTKCGSQ
jgi:hypothetical protein